MDHNAEPSHPRGFVFTFPGLHLTGRARPTDLRVVVCGAAFQVLQRTAETGWSRYGGKTDDIYPATNASGVHSACIGTLVSDNHTIEAAIMIGRVEPGVDTWVNYYKSPADGSPPELNDLGLLLGDKNMETRLMRINDARGREHEFNLDDHGFQFAKLDSNVTDFTDKEYVKSTYYPEVEDLVKRLTGCSTVKSFAFNHRTAPVNDFGKPFAGYQGTQGPAKRLHVDSTPFGAAHMIDHMWPEEAEDIKKRGYLFINVWRPLATIRRDPLIVANMAHFPTADLVRIERKYYDGMIGQNYVPKYDGMGAVKAALPDGGTENGFSRANEGVADGRSNGGSHSWWFLDEMKTDEVVLFSCSGKRPGMETVADGGTVHGSVVLPDQDDKPVRQSVEVHLVAIF